MGAGDGAGQGEGDAAGAFPRRLGDGAPHPIVVGVGGQLGIEPPLLHEVHGAAEHGGHLRPGQGALGQEAVGLIAPDDAVCIQQVDIGLQGGGDGAGVRKIHGVGAQVFRHGVQLHGPHQIHGQALPADGLEQAVVRTQGPQLGHGEDAGLQAHGHLLRGPGVEAVREELRQLVRPVGGDGGLVLLADAGGPGAEQQGLAGGHLLVGGKGGGAGALDHPLGGQILHVVTGPVAHHVGKSDRGGGYGQQGDRRQRGQRQRQDSPSFHCTYLPFARFP